MERLPDWKPRLVAFLQRQAELRRPGDELDCALFAAAAVNAMTGVDLAMPWRGYGSIEEGMEALRAAGFTDHVALAASLLEEIRTGDGEPWPAAAQPGDVAVVPVEGGRSLGIVQGQAIYVVGRGGRLSAVPLTRATRAFRVPGPCPRS